MAIDLLKTIASKKKLSEFLSPESIGQFKRYLTTGFISFGTEYLLYFMLHKLLSVKYMTANIAVYAAVFWLNFLLNRFWSFKSHNSFWRQLMLYSMLFLFNLFAVNILLMFVLTELAGINPLISKIMVMGVIVLWNFILYKKVIYK